MYLLGKRADEITEFDINRLLENQIQENKNLDYKRDLKLSKDSDKKEFLFDISAMYNTDGGCFIFGIEELKDEKGQNTGKPSKIAGLKIENSDKLIQQIEDILKNSTEPSISQILLREIEIDSNKLLIIGVPKGLGLPSMVTFNRTNKFYKRRNSGKFLVDVHELNQMFMQNQVLIERANEFRKNRINDILNQENNPNLNIKHSFFIHIIPYNFLTNQLSSLALFEDDLRAKMRPFSYGSEKGWRDKFNFDGFSTFSSAFKLDEITSYNQLFRNGIYEVYSSNVFYQTRHQKDGFNGKSLLESTIESINQGLSILDDLAIDSPFLVSYSFRNVEGMIMDSELAYNVPEFHQNNLDFPFVQVPSPRSDTKKLMKPNFDILWQTFGHKESPIR